MSEDRLNQLQLLIMQKLMEPGSKGVTRFDFPDYPELDEEMMSSVMASIEQLSHLDGGGVLQ